MGFRSLFAILSLSLMSGPLAAQNAVDGADTSAVQAKIIAAKSAEPILRLILAPKLAPSWADANIARLVLRSEEAQRGLPHSSTDKTRRLEIPLQQGEEGCMLLLVELGPPEAKGRPDSWRRVSHSSKTVLCSIESSQDLAARRGATSLLTAKTGAKTEIRPLMNPATLRPGADLAVRVYFEGEAQPGAEVKIFRAGAPAKSAFTDSVGIATLSLPSAGLWTLSYQHLHRGEPYQAELRFEVESDHFWASIPKED